MDMCNVTKELASFFISIENKELSMNEIIDARDEWFMSHRDGSLYRMMRIADDGTLYSPIAGVDGQHGETKTFKENEIYVGKYYAGYSIDELIWKWMCDDMPPDEYVICKITGTVDEEEMRNNADRHEYFREVVMSSMTIIEIVGFVSDYV